jgi:hypothetical protein
MGQMEMECIFDIGKRYFYFGQGYSGERCGPWASCYPTRCVSSIPSPRLRDRKHTTRWIKIISHHKPWEILYILQYDFSGDVHPYKLVQRNEELDYVPCTCATMSSHNAKYYAKKKSIKKTSAHGRKIDILTVNKQSI